MGGEGLDDDFAFHFATAGASCHLGEELEGAFASAEVGDVEREVGIENGGEGDVREVESLGDHLGAEEDIDLARTEGGEGIFERVFAAGGIGVEPSEGGFWEDFAENLFDFFGAKSL